MTTTILAENTENVNEKINPQEYWRKLHDADLSLIPINAKTKQPHMGLLPTGEDGKATWAPFTVERPTLQQFKSWMSARPQALAVVCGRVSGGLEILDFDDNAQSQPSAYSSDAFFTPFYTATQELIERCGIPIWQTGGGGYALGFRCDVIGGNQKLAWVPDSTQKFGRSIGIETRGEGGYAVVPHSLHPSGKYYTPLDGDLFNVPVITPDERKFLLDAARALCLMPYTAQELRNHKQTKQRAGSADHSVISQFNQENRITDVLARHGYTEQGAARWSRPGKAESLGVAILSAENVSFHWSSNDPLQFTNGNGCPLPVDPFQAYTYLEHGGDHQTAFIAAKKMQGRWVEQRVEVAPEPPPYVGLDPETGEIFDGAAGVGAEPEPDEPEERNPLDVAVTGDLKLGWIDEYAELMTQLTASPRGFNVLAGLVTVATAIKRGSWLNLSFGTIYPNVYTCIVAPSTYWHKTTAVNKSKDMLRRASLEDLLLANDMTYEGLIKAMELRPAGLVINNEIHRLLGSHNTKYMLTLKPALTDLYDCEPFERALSSKTIYISAPYLNVMGTTTPAAFHENVRNLDWMDGFMVRWLYVTEPTCEPDFAAQVPLWTSVHQQTVDRLAHRLATVASRPPGAALANQEALEMWNAWRVTDARAAWRFGDEVVSYIAGRYATYALKFALILSAINKPDTPIDVDTMQTAINLAGVFKRNVFKLIQGKAQHSVSGAKLQVVFRLIQRAGAGITTRSLMALSNMRKAELAPVLDKMLEAGYITEQLVAPHGKRYTAVVGKLPVRTVN